MPFYQWSLSSSISSVIDPPPPYLVCSFFGSSGPRAASWPTWADLALAQFALGVWSLPSSPMPRPFPRPPPPPPRGIPDWMSSYFSQPDERSHGTSASGMAGVTVKARRAASTSSRIRSQYQVQFPVSGGSARLEKHHQQLVANLHTLMTTVGRLRSRRQRKRLQRAMWRQMPKTRRC